MVFAAALFVSGLLASAAMAAPRGAGLQSRIQSRKAGTRRSHPLTLVGGDEPAVKGNSSNEQYSSNWAGAVFDSYPSVYNFHHAYWNHN
jgi:hypothetical protein